MTLWRAVVLQPLLDADPPWTQSKMAQELTLRAQKPGGDSTAAAASGRSKATLGKFIAGEKMPTRDLVQHLLDLATEVVEAPPLPAAMESLWQAYMTALREAAPLRAALYDAVDARDSAKFRIEVLTNEIEDQKAAQALLEQEKDVLSILLGHALEEQRRSERIAQMRHHDAQRVRDDITSLNQRVLDAESQRDEVFQLLAQYLTGRPEGEITLMLASASRNNPALQALTRASKVRDAAVSAVGPASLPPAAGQSSTAGHADERRELEARHRVAVRAIAHLTTLLQKTSQDLADARTQLLCRDHDLTRLVEQHAEQIESLHAERVLAEADQVLDQIILGWDHPPELTSAGAFPSIPETTRSPSSTPPTSHVKTSASPDGPARHPFRRVPPTDRPRPEGPALPSADTTGARPGRNRTRRSDHSDKPRPDVPPMDTSRQRIRRTFGMAMAFLGVVVVVPTIILLIHNWVSDNTATKPTSSPTAPPTTARVPSALPGQPADDPVADIGDQPVNTADIMKLPVCVRDYIDVSLTATFDGYVEGESVQAELAVSADEEMQGKMPCRLDAGRAKTTLTVRPKGKDTVVWNSADCAQGHSGHRWIQLTRTRPAKVTFTWKHHTLQDHCRSGEYAPPGNYVARAAVSGEDRAGTSFFLEDNRKQTQPSTSATPEKSEPSPTTETPSYTSIGGLFEGTSGETETPSESWNSSPSPTEGAPSGGNGESQGIFGGPQG
ncbi:hypothetical protein [Streptomyces sp. NBC_01334]|uniref:hypothetical protein n=1 Tax=Streptomyces sp. NBC_01334 TaxID=2903827 RepID=UPI002E106401|nr:hypothetical protein OG736_46795 [Streptomyces sp. NBC_01334]